MAADRAEREKRTGRGLLRVRTGTVTTTTPTTAVEVVGCTGVPADSLASYGSHYEKPCLSPSFASSRLVLASLAVPDLPRVRARARLAPRLSRDVVGSVSPRRELPSTPLAPMSRAI